jgi:hypothetical protein
MATSRWNRSRSSRTPSDATHVYSYVHYMYTGPPKVPPRARVQQVPFGFEWFFVAVLACTGSSWPLLASPGSALLFLAPPCCSWLHLGFPGSLLLLTPPASWLQLASWRLLAPPSSFWLLLPFLSCIECTKKFRQIFQTYSRKYTSQETMQKRT